MPNIHVPAGGLLLVSTLDSNHMALSSQVKFGIILYRAAACTRRFAVRLLGSVHCVDKRFQFSWQLR